MVFDNTSKGSITSLKDTCVHLHNIDTTRDRLQNNIVTRICRTPILFMFYVKFNHTIHYRLRHLYKTRLFLLVQQLVTGNPNFPKGSTKHLRTQLILTNKEAHNSIINIHIKRNSISHWRRGACHFCKVIMHKKVLCYFRGRMAERTQRI